MYEHIFDAKELLPELMEYYTGYQYIAQYEIIKWIITRNRLSEAQNHHCAYCGCKMTSKKKKANEVTIDHIIPKSQLGTNDWENLVAACASCNTLRGSIDPYEFFDTVQYHKSRLHEYRTSKHYHLPLRKNSIVKHLLRVFK